MIYWFFGYPGIGKDYLAEKLSQLAQITHIDVDNFLTKTDKKKLIEGTFTKKDRLSKLQRLTQAIKDPNQDYAVADSLPDNTSRLFLRKNFKENIVFILVQASLKTHQQRLKKRKDHFFIQEMAQQYIAKNWELIKNFKHEIIKNKNGNSKKIEKDLLKIYKKYTH